MADVGWAFLDLMVNLVAALAILALVGFLATLLSSKVRRLLLRVERDRKTMATAFELQDKSVDEVLDHVAVELDTMGTEVFEAGKTDLAGELFQIAAEARSQKRERNEVACGHEHEGYVCDLPAGHDGEHVCWTTGKRWAADG